MMSHFAQRHRAARAPEPDAVESINRLVGTIGAEIEALKQEREADQIRSARLSLGAAHARARLDRRSNEASSA